MNLQKVGIPLCRSIYFADICNIVYQPIDTMAAFKTLKELIRGLQTGDKLLVDMFNKRKTLAIRYDDAVDTLDGDENKLRFLISHGVILQTGNTLELDDNYLQFFENVLEVNEDINVESVRQYIGRLQLGINSYLAADSDVRRRQFLREIRHTLRGIDQTTRRNIIDLKRNVENTYKQEPNYKLKKIRLGDFDRKSRDIGELIKQTELLIDHQTVFFRTAMDALLQQTVHEVGQGLGESAHALIDIQKQIIDYLNRIEFQNRIVRKVRALKYLKDQFMIEECTNARAVLAAHNPVWMEPAARYSTKVSESYMQNSDEALSIIDNLRRQLTRKTAVRQRLNAPIESEYLSPQQEAMRAFNHQELFNAFKAQGSDLFTFMMHHDFHAHADMEDRLVLYLQLASQYPDELRFTGERRVYQQFEYPIILPL